MSKVDEAQEILRAFDFDRRRTNETAARTLLALAGMDERATWAEATNERMGVRAILDWMRGPLGHPIAENSRETIRRFVLHQFVMMMIRPVRPILRRITTVCLQRLF